MEAIVLVGIAAGVSAFACALASWFAVSAAAHKRRAAMAAQGTARSLEGVLSWRLRNGCVPLVPLAGKLLRERHVARFADDAAALCAARGLATAPEALVSLAAAAVLALGFAAGIATGSAIGALAVPLCCAACLAAYVANACDRRQEAVRDAVPDALASMSACFGSGFTLLQTFKQVADDVKGPLGSAFATSAHMLEMGSGADRALEELRRGSNASDLAFVAVALDVQHQSGGAMGQVLDAAAEAVKGEMALRRSLRVQTAQAKLSARVVSIMPAVLIAAFSLASPDFLAPFFASPFGYALLALAIIMQVSGIALVRRALNVEGVS